MKRILITRPRAQAGDFAEKLSAAGFEPIFFPVIEIRPIENNVALERALSKLECYEWIVFTSVNAVDVVARSEATMQSPDGLRGLLRRGASRSDISTRVAAIGPKTAEALQARGVQ